LFLFDLELLCNQGFGTLNASSIKIAGITVKATASMRETPLFNNRLTKELSIMANKPAKTSGTKISLAIYKKAISAQSPNKYNGALGISEVLCEDSI